MMKKPFFQRWTRCLQAVIAVGALALLAACGGGGGGGGSSAPRFERTTLGVVPAIRDNTTGIYWATQLNTTIPSGVAPTAQELLTVADLGTDVLTSNFSFLLNQQVQAAEPVHGDNTRAWVVDFGVQRPGGLSDEATDINAPFAQWQVLQRPREADQLQRDGAVVLQGKLLWSACTLGTTMNRDLTQCDGGTPSFKTLADAKAAASSSRLQGFSDWRLPTKQELQGLLTLRDGQGTLLLPIFADVDQLGVQLEYWTSSTQTFTGRPTTFWNVNFNFSVNDVGGVDDVTTDSMALVRLVRTR